MRGRALGWSWVLALVVALLWAGAAQARVRPGGPAGHGATTSTAAVPSTPKPVAIKKSAKGPDAYTTAFNSPAGPLIPGTTDIGNHCDDCVTTLLLPFGVRFYGATYDAVAVSSNGNVQFDTSSDDYHSGCLPNATFGATIFAYQGDLVTDGMGEGIFTAVTGVAPHRHLVIEWRSERLADAAPVNFEIVLYEGSPEFTIIYGSAVADSGASEVVGTQAAGTAGSDFTQVTCNQGALFAHRRVDFVGTEYDAGSVHSQLDNKDASHQIFSEKSTDSTTQYDSQAADDFTVNTGRSNVWTWIDHLAAVGTFFGTGPGQSVNVFIYRDLGGKPGTLVYQQTEIPNIEFTDGTLETFLFPPAQLPNGHYWLSVQANAPFETTPWFWSDRTVQSGAPAQWQNPPNGFNTGCTTWCNRGTVDTPADPDQVFAVYGHIGLHAMPPPRG